MLLIMFNVIILRTVYFVKVDMKIIYGIFFEHKPSYLY